MFLGTQCRTRIFCINVYVFHSHSTRIRIAFILRLQTSQRLQSDGSEFCGTEVGARQTEMGAIQGKLCIMQ